MRIVPLVTFAAACLLVPDLGAQTVARAVPRAAVSPHVEASLRAVPRPMLLTRERVPLRGGRAGTFTPASLKGVSESELAKGRVVGVATLGASNTLGVPAGTYDYVVAKSGGKWHLYAMSNGRVVKEARNVMVRTPATSGSTHRSSPTISPSGGSPRLTAPHLVLTPDSVGIPDALLLQLMAAGPSDANELQDCNGTASTPHPIRVVAIDTHGAEVSTPIQLHVVRNPPPDNLVPDLAPSRITIASSTEADLYLNLCDFLAGYVTGKQFSFVFSAPGYLSATFRPVVVSNVGDGDSVVMWGW